MRDFNTGATRDSADWKLDLKGFVSARAIHLLGRYMHFHRKQADGKLRDSDNWKRGIPIPVYEESFVRHFWEWAKALEKAKEDFVGSAKPPFDHREAIVAALGMFFNLQGWLHEQAKEAERLGIDLDGLIEVEAMHVKDRDTAEAKRSMVVQKVDYERLKRAQIDTYEAERARKNPFFPGVNQLREAGIPVTFTEQRDTKPYHGPLPPNHHGLAPVYPWGPDGPGFSPRQANDLAYHRPTAPGQKPLTDEFSDDYFHPDTFAQSAVEGHTKPVHHEVPGHGTADEIQDQPTAGAILGLDLSLLRPFDRR